MPTETTIKNLGQHEAAVNDFFSNMPHNRETYTPYKGYEFIQHKSHHSRQNRRSRGKGIIQTYAPKVGATITLMDGIFQEEGKVIAKSVSKWFGTGRNYIIFSSMLVYIQPNKKVGKGKQNDNG